jgi:hypothetical protein
MAFPLDRLQGRAMGRFGTHGEQMRWSAPQVLPFRTKQTTLTRPSVGSQEAAQKRHAADKRQPEPA